MTTNAFLCEFKYRKKRENLIDIHQDFRNMAKDNFLYAIIDRSEEQRKLAVNQSNTLSELSKKIVPDCPALKLSNSISSSALGV